jgi:hypothetical protein
MVLTITLVIIMGYECKCRTGYKRDQWRGEEKILRGEEDYSMLHVYV